MTDGQTARPKKRLLSLGTDRLLFEKGSAVRERIAGYAKDWEEIHIVVAADRSFKESVIQPNVWIYPTRSRIKALYFLDMIRLGRFIASRRGITDITCQDPFLSAIAGVSLKKQFGIPLELQVHTDVGSPHYPRTWANKVRKSLALSHLPKADSVRVVSNKIKDYLVGTLDIAGSKITVRPIFVDTEKIRNAPVTVDLRKKYPRFDKIALMASRMTSEKNIDLAIEAWKEVVTKSPKAGLIIVGRGPKEKPLKRLVAALGLESSVVFEPWADQPTLASYYKTADLFLNTSLFEGYGMTLVEAHAAGCKIVSTDVGVAKETGAVIVDWDPESAARGVIQALGV